MKAKPFLAELAGVKKIAGTGALRFDISSHGNTPREIVGHLDGKGEINVSDGSVEGADLAAVAKFARDGAVGRNSAGGGGRNRANAFPQPVCQFRDGKWRDAQPGYGLLNSDG